VLAYVAVYSRSWTICVCMPYFFPF